MKEITIKDLSDKFSSVLENDYFIIPNTRIQITDYDFKSKGINDKLEDDYVYAAYAKMQENSKVFIIKLKKSYLLDNPNEDVIKNLQYSFEEEIKLKNKPNETN